MIFLHPVITLLFLLLIAGSFVDVYGGNRRDSRVLLWTIVVVMVLIGGFRQGVGADYGVYERMFFMDMQMVDMRDLVDKMLFRESKVEIEWAYILLNKWVFALGMPFFIFTAIVSAFTIFGRALVYDRNLEYPVFAMMLFLVPVYFTTDNGHMRQAISMVICLISYKFIKERKLVPFLILMYLAFGFHKSAIIFLPAYWLVLVPMNRWRIVLAIGICILLSPLHLYEMQSGLLDTLAPPDVNAGYTGYIEAEDKASTFMDILMLVYSVFLVMFDRVACKNVYYYEYIRNILVAGVCLYFIFRDNPAFSTRLAGMYTGFATMVMPAIAYALPMRQKRMFHLYFVVFVVFYYFVFANFQGSKTGWLPEMYHNYLWNF